MKTMRRSDVISILGSPDSQAPEIAIAVHHEGAAPKRRNQEQLPARVVVEVIDEERGIGDPIRIDAPFALLERVVEAVRRGCDLDRYGNVCPDHGRHKPDKNYNCPSCVKDEAEAAGDLDDTHTCAQAATQTS